MERTRTEDRTPAERLADLERSAGTADPASWLAEVTAAYDAEAARITDPAQHGARQGCCCHQRNPVDDAARAAKRAQAR